MRVACPDCGAKSNKFYGSIGYQCYCSEIAFIRQVHQRYQTKPVESRPLLVPTSKLPRGGIKLWVDIMPREDSKRFIPGYYLPENYVKGLFEKANSHKKVNKTFGDAQIIEAISKLDEINKVSIFFGDSKGNSIIRQCIAFKNDKLLEYFLKMKPLAAFVRHAREERRAVFAGAEGGEDEDGDDDDDDNESDA